MTSLNIVQVSIMAGNLHHTILYVILGLYFVSKWFMYTCTLFVCTIYNIQEFFCNFGKGP